MMFMVTLNLFAHMPHPDSINGRAIFGLLALVIPVAVAMWTWRISK
jgi:hypothetical protein